MSSAIDISKIYKESAASRTYVLRDVGLSMHEGEFVVIMGDSGVGKTTLINVLSPLDANPALLICAVLEKYRRTYGGYPEAVMVDNSYREQANIKYCNSKDIRISGSKLGRPKKGETYDKIQAHRDDEVKGYIRPPH